jgi:HSP20 family protein
MNPRRELTVFPEDAFGDLLTGFFRPLPTRANEVMPRVKIDVTENPEAYEVAAEMPGVKKEDLDVRVDGNVVTLSGHIETTQETKEGDKLLRQERQYGAVSRQFALASDIDEARTAARYENGILYLTLPKRERSGSKRVKITG